MRILNSITGLSQEHRLYFLFTSSLTHRADYERKLTEIINILRLCPIIPIREHKRTNTRHWTHRDSNIPQTQNHSPYVTQQLVAPIWWHRHSFLSIPVTRILLEQTITSIILLTWICYSRPAWPIKRVGLKHHFITAPLFNSGRTRR